MNDQIRIELAQTQDATAIVEIHYAAVHQTARSFYPEEVLNSWSRLITNERVERMKRIIENSDEWLIVAKQDNHIVGFGSIFPKNNEIGGLYVHPSFGRRGVGEIIITVLEHEAKSSGLSYLKVNASLNAEAFYCKHGFEITEYATHQLASGQKMACVKMRKTLNNYTTP